MASLAMGALLPTKWVPRTGLGWEVEHFLIYFATTFALCIALRRPVLVAGRFCSSRAYSRGCRTLRLTERLISRQHSLEEAALFWGQPSSPSFCGRGVGHARIERIG